MFEGSNKITFSEGTAKELFSGFMSGFLQTPVEVTDISADYNGVKIEFTEADAIQPENELEKKEND